MRYYAYTGNWIPPMREGQRGVSLAVYDGESHVLKAGRLFSEDVNCGALCLDVERRILYGVNERPEINGEPGGQVIAWKIGPDGTLTELGRQSSLGPLPSYCAFSEDRKYLAVTNHSSRNSIVRAVLDLTGNYRLVREHDEASIVLFPLNADGSIGKACHLLRHEGHAALPGQQSPHLHSVVLSPDGKFLAVCDKGNDGVYLYRIDEERRELVLCDRLAALPGSSPRYCRFHPSLPLLYFNCETKSVLCTAAYTEEGKFSLVTSVSCRSDGSVEHTGMQSDLVIDHNAQYLYDLVREGGQIAVFSLDEETGLPGLLRCVDCGSPEGGRGLALSPDGRHLYLASSPEKEILAFAVDGGELKPLGAALEDIAPGNLVFCPQEES